MDSLKSRPSLASLGSYSIKEGVVSTPSEGNLRYTKEQAPNGKGKEKAVLKSCFE